MKYKYKIFCPYFGKLPNNFLLWIKSCSYNNNFKFYVITNDIVEIELPENVEIISMSFDEFKTIVQSKFEFKIKLNKYYKLCDLKPMYGYIFEEKLDDCEYFGFCDMDLIFGDLNRFLPENIEKYSKISLLGHFCMIKNQKEFREVFMDGKNSKISYKDILSSDIHFGFDEIGYYGINAIFLKNNYNIYNFENNVADISCARPGMVLAKHTQEGFKPIFGNRIFSFEAGHIYEYLDENKTIVKNEYAYIHFQKRNMINNVVSKNPSKFLILPNSFEDYQIIDSNYLKSIKIKKTSNLLLNFKIKSAQKRLIRYLEIKKIIKRREKNGKVK